MSDAASDFPVVPVEHRDAGTGAGVQITLALQTGPDTVVIPDVPDDLFTLLKHGFEIVTGDARRRPVRVYASEPKGYASVRQVVVLLHRPPAEPGPTGAACDCPDGACRVDRALDEPGYSLCNAWAELGAVPQRLRDGLGDPPAVQSGAVPADHAHITSHSAAHSFFCPKVFPPCRDH